MAFNAPIGGLLFAFEEVASFFNTSLGWLIFFGGHPACSPAAIMSVNLVLFAWWNGIRVRWSGPSWACRLHGFSTHVEYAQISAALSIRRYGSLWE